MEKVLRVIDGEEVLYIYSFSLIIAKLEMLENTQVVNGQSS